LYWRKKLFLHLSKENTNGYSLSEPRIFDPAAANEGGTDVSFPKDFHETKCLGLVANSELGSVRPYPPPTNLVGFFREFVNVLIPTVYSRCARRFFEIPFDPESVPDPNPAIKIFRRRSSVPDNQSSDNYERTRILIDYSMAEQRYNGRYRHLKPYIYRPSKEKHAIDPHGQVGL